VNPEEEQERLVRTILDHWKNEVARVHHPSRARALDIVQFVRTFEEAFNEASFSEKAHTIKTPFVVMPDAKLLPGAWSYEELRRTMEAAAIPGDEPELGSAGLRPVMIVFGTGWGISPTFYDKVDRPLKPLWGPNRAYNHLSVRAAAAIVLDRVLGEHD
jgi:hypothetical protein